MAGQPVLAPAAEFAFQEQQVLDAAEAAILDLWLRLGVELTTTEGEMRLTVAAPDLDPSQHAAL
ncbi:hypothetical protein ACQP00_20530 [Dactylosporangium sp. CS-047395]|uniref:hypothetical protein n=1 Tax=Dactylosporangium sp. CS-047395 TaxID=3239936 RepID=UPI003D91499C